MKDLIFITHSEHKLNEAETILGCQLKRYDIELPEIQSVSVEEVVREKVRFAYNELRKQNWIGENRAVLVEDTGLYIEAWNGLPGALIKWFIQHPKPDGICKMLVDFNNRRARAESIVAVYDGNLQLFQGEVWGEISLEPRGTNGFGWDTIFIPTGETLTFGQMKLEEKIRFSMRRKAFEKMREFYFLQGKE